MLPFVSEHTKLVYLEFELNHLAVLGKMFVAILHPHNSNKHKAQDSRRGICG